MMEYGKFEEDMVLLGFEKVLSSYYNDYSPRLGVTFLANPIGLEVKAMDEVNYKFHTIHNYYIDMYTKTLEQVRYCIELYEKDNNVFTNWSKV